MVVRSLRVGSESLLQVKGSSSLVREGRMEPEINRWSGAASEVMKVLWQNAVVKRELSQKAKLSIYHSIEVFHPHL